MLVIGIVSFVGGKGFSLEFFYVSVFIRVSVCERVGFIV